MGISFCLRELDEFFSMLEEREQNAFMRRFVACMQRLLICKEMQMSYWSSTLSSDVVTGAPAPALLVRPFDLQTDWQLLKEMVYYMPNYQQLEQVMRKHAFLNGCFRRLEKLEERGVRHIIGHCRYYKLIRRQIKSSEMDVCFQDLFSIAVAKFIRNGWGNGETFRKMLADM